MEDNDARRGEPQDRNPNKGQEVELIDLEEKRRKECLGTMEKIEKEFADLKEKFFQEKIEGLKKEYELIKTGNLDFIRKKN
jgi:hypothetical protein